MCIYMHIQIDRYILHVYIYTYRGFLLPTKHLNLKLQDNDWSGNSGGDWSGPDWSGGGGGGGKEWLGPGNDWSGKEWNSGSSGKDWNGGNEWKNDKWKSWKDDVNDEWKDS